MLQNVFGEGLEAIVIIVALGGLEIALWWADHKRQAEQLATLEAIWVELALLNEDRTVRHQDRLWKFPLFGQSICRFHQLRLRLLRSDCVLLRNTACHFGGHWQLQ